MGNHSVVRLFVKLILLGSTFPPDDPKINPPHYPGERTQETRRQPAHECDGNYSRAFWEVGPYSSVTGPTHGQIWSDEAFPNVPKDQNEPDGHDARSDPVRPPNLEQAWGESNQQQGQTRPVEEIQNPIGVWTVSYTHLTLPTSDLV